MKALTFESIYILIVSLILLFTSGCQNQIEKEELDEFRSMSNLQNQNKEIARALFQAIDNNNFDKINELLADDFSLEAPLLEKTLKKNDLQPIIQHHYASFPDWIHEIEELIAEGDQVAVKALQVGTHKEAYEGIAATNKRITNPALSILTIDNGKIKHWWVIEDWLGFQQQLGMKLVPAQEK